MTISKRSLLKGAGAAALASVVPAESEAAGTPSSFRQAPVVGCRRVAASEAKADTAKVYFSRKIDAETLIRLYRLVNAGITGNVGIKLHTGEKHGPNILPRDMVRAFQAQIPNSAIVECNTLYHGDRYTTKGHLETLKVNGWTFCPVDIMDADDKYVDFPVKNGLRLKKVAMGAHLANYDSLVVLTHFKGHAMGGFGGSLKNIAIGCASGRVGKAEVHGVKPWSTDLNWGAMPMKDQFMELMADSGKATCDHFGRHITFLNVMRRMSVDCDCAGTSAAEPTIPDIGILASTDILAIDQASCDLVYGSGHNHDLVERMESRHGLAQLDAMRRNRMGASTYQLIEI